MENLKEDVKGRMNDQLRNKSGQIHKDIKSINKMKDRYFSKLQNNNQRQKIGEYKDQNIQIMDCLKSKKYYESDIYEKLGDLESKLGKLDMINDAYRLENYVQNNMAQQIFKNVAELD